MGHDPEMICRVTLMWSCQPRQVQERDLQLDPGTTVADALRAADLTHDTLAGAALSIWGRKCSPDTVLRDGDRLELTRPLLVDPKVARKERFGRQGARMAGLFSRQRGTGKAG